MIKRTKIILTTVGLLLASATLGHAQRIGNGANVGTATPGQAAIYSGPNSTAGTSVLSGIGRDSRVASPVTTTSTLNFNAATTDEAWVTAQAGAITIANPTNSGTGRRIVYRIKDSGSTRAITWDTDFRALSGSLPSATVAGVEDYYIFEWNTTASKWDFLSCVACSGGGGSGTVNSGSSGEVAYYASTGTAVSGKAVTGSGNAVLAVGPTLTGDTKFTATTGTCATATESMTAVAFNLAAGNCQIVTLTGNDTLSVTNGGVGKIFTLILIQDGMGNRVPTWFSNIKWAGGVSTLSTAGSAIDSVTFVQTSATPDYIAVMTLDYN